MMLHCQTLSLSTCIKGVLLVLGLVQVGCTFHTTDLTRPIMIDERKLKELDDTDRLATCHGRQDTQELKRWLRPVRTAMVFFTVTAYDEYPHEIQSLTEFLQRTPNQPYGWIALGMFFALQHKTEAAIEATWEGLHQLEEIRQCPPDVLAQLGYFYVVGLLNVAIYNNSLERYAEAVRALAMIDDAKLDPFQRLAYHWLAAQAFSGAKKFRKAEDSLGASLLISDRDLRNVTSWIRYNYPQYFARAYREASIAYLTAVLALDRGEPKGAEEQFRHAIAKREKMWEAQYGLSNALVAQGRVDEAQEILLKLLKHMPDDGYFRREVVLFSLGNVYGMQNRLDDAIDSYLKAVESGRGRSDKYVSALCCGPELDDHSRAGQIVGRTLKPSNQGYPEAENNLANVYFQKLERGDFTAIQESEIIREMENLYRHAAANEIYQTRHLAMVNLARLHWRQGRYSDFFVEMAQALRLKPDDSSLLKLLFENADRAGTIDLTIRGFEIVIDTLLDIGISPSAWRPYPQYIGSVVEHMQKRLEAFPNGPARARALSRLYVLTGERARNRELLQVTLEQAPRAIFALVGLARLDLERGQEGGGSAKSLLDRALSTPQAAGERPTEAVDRRDAHYLRGHVLMGQGDFQGAREDFVKALAITPGWAPAQLGLQSLPSAKQ